MKSLSSRLTNILALIVVGYCPMAVMAAEGAPPAPVPPQTPAQKSAAPTSTITVDRAWLSIGWKQDGEKNAGGLEWDESWLWITMAIAPPPGWRVIGQPTVAVTAARDAAGTDLLLPNTDGEGNYHHDTELGSTQPTYVQIKIRAPSAPFSGLREFKGTGTVHLVRNQPQEAVLKPLSTWIGKPVALAKMKGPEFTLARGDDGHLRVTFNAAAAMRFAHLRLTTVAGDELTVDEQNDDLDNETNTVTRMLPEDTPADATLAIGFYTIGEFQTVPFSFAPLALPMPISAPVKASTEVELHNPPMEPSQAIRPADGRF